MTPCGSDLEPLLSKRRRGPGHKAGRKPHPDRAVLTGILFVLCGGLPWQLLPLEMRCGSPAAQDDLRFVFRIPDLPDRKDLRNVTMDDIRKYHQIRPRYEAKAIRAAPSAVERDGPCRI